jgi:hypothetical protein
MNTSSAMKRIVIAMLLGLAVGVPCAIGVFSLGILKFTAVNLVWVLLNRGVMGFAIGVSGLKLHWAWNGILVGLVVGLLFSYFLFMNMGLQTLPVANALINGLFGLIIEFFTTVVFKQPAFVSSRTTKQTALA